MPADETRLAKLVMRLGVEVRACVEMMSGAVWVRDRLQAAGWQVEVAVAQGQGPGAAGLPRPTRSRRAGAGRAVPP
ncbi:MAG: hypothetical protein U0S48_13665 [Solirubrobacteraceae bacterium]